MLLDQDGRCAICNGDFGEETPRIDHDHRCCPTDKTCGLCVRQLLCNRCNVVLGLIGDDPHIALALINYLVKFGGDNPYLE